MDRERLNQIRKMLDSGRENGFDEDLTKETLKAAYEMFNEILRLNERVEVLLGVMNDVY
jgi:hypothetical protein